MPKFTCAYLRHEHSVVISVENCIAVIDLKSYKWTSKMMRNEGGVVFNKDREQKAVVYMEPNHHNHGSDIFMVRIPETQ